MKTSELEEIYVTACRGKGYEPNDGQFKIWKQTLGWCEQADLAQALVWWFTENSEFPMPAELKRLSEKSRRDREAKAAVLHDLITYQCPVCRVTRSGWPADPERQRYCMNVAKDGDGRCGAILQIVHLSAQEMVKGS